MNELSWQWVVLLLGILLIPCVCYIIKHVLNRPNPNNNLQAIITHTLQRDFEYKFMQDAIDSLLKKEINFFFSGSKSLEIERNIFSNTVVGLQTKWKDKGLSIYGYSYQSPIFKHEVVLGSHQDEYNDFIQNRTDAIFFVLNGNVGGYTNEEFKLAMKAFKQKGSPKIFIYSKINDASDPSIEELRKIVSEEKQYWQDYKDETHLTFEIEKDMTGVIEKINESNIEKRKKILNKQQGNILCPNLTISSSATAAMAVMRLLAIFMTY